MCGFVSMGSHRVGHDWSDLAAAAAAAAAAAVVQNIVKQVYWDYLSWGDILSDQEY